MLNLLLKMVCNFDKQQCRECVKAEAMAAMTMALAASVVFPLLCSSFISYSRILIAPLCNILLTHACTQTLEFIEWSDCNYSIRLLLPLCLRFRFCS